jgi:RND family efflux transporter MFP subunit
MNPRTRLLLQIGIPVALILVGAAIFLGLVTARRVPERQQRIAPPPLVQVLEVVPEDARLDVSSHGEVAARTQTLLVAQVAGQVIEVAPALVSGGFFEKGEVLAKIDPRDYRVAVSRAEARVAQERVRLAREEGEARIAREDWDSLGGGGEPDPLVVREPQLAEARAALTSAEAEVEKARLDLARTEVVAPYAGRVRSKSVDVGQYLAPGAAIARIYAVDVAEVRLPIPRSDVGFVELPLDFRTDRSAPGPGVVLRAEFGGRWWEWEGRIVRTEAEIDPRTRMVHAVARVEDPYGRLIESDSPPLAVGLFVEAEIEGRVVSDVFVLPRAALRGTGRVIVVDGEDRLRFRDVDVLRLHGERMVIRGGLEEGELVCISPLEVAVDGMQVRVAAASPERTSP